VKDYNDTEVVKVMPTLDGRYSKVGLMMHH